MAILKRSERDVFDTAQIKRGYFVSGQHKSWSEAVNGLVADVSEDELLIQFLPEIRNVTNHYRIRTEEVAAGEWILKLSPDLVTVEEVEGAAKDGTA